MYNVCSTNFEEIKYLNKLQELCYEWTILEEILNNVHK